MLIEKNQRLVFTGDSVTDVGRARPIGEGRDRSLGDGYPLFVDAMIRAWMPDHPIRVTNMGISGYRSRDLLSTWQEDCLDLLPDWVSICIGINDVWRRYDVPFQKERAVELDEYEENLKTILDRTIPLVKGVILCTPYYLEPNRDDAMRKDMDRYCEVCRKLAKEYNLPLVDFQAAFDEALQYIYPSTFTWDRIHPNASGHMVMARAFLKAIDFPIKEIW